MLSKNTQCLSSSQTPNSPKHIASLSSDWGRHRSVGTRKLFPACYAASGGHCNAISRSTTLGWPTDRKLSRLIEWLYAGSGWGIDTAPAHINLAVLAPANNNCLYYSSNVDIKSSSSTMVTKLRYHSLDVAGSSRRQVLCFTMSSFNTSKVRLKISLLSVAYS